MQPVQIVNKGTRYSNARHLCASCTILTAFISEGMIILFSSSSQMVHLTMVCLFKGKLSWVLFVLKVQRDFYKILYLWLPPASSSVTSWGFCAYFAWVSCRHSVLDTMLRSLNLLKPIFLQGRSYENGTLFQSKFYREIIYPLGKNPHILAYLLSLYNH